MGSIVNFFCRYFSSPKSLANKAFKKSIYTITRLQPNNIALYELALQHSSLQAVHQSNERLEFLGDAVLSLIIAEHLFKKYPLQEEGFLTEIRSRIVNRVSLGELAQKIGVDALLQYDHRSMHRRNLPTIYGNALEAFIGAVYLDQGYEKCRFFVIQRILSIYIDIKELIQTDHNYKSKMIAWAQKNRKAIVFKLANEKKVGNGKEFLMHLCIEDRVVGQGYGNTKKQAEQMAARDALTHIL
jgi:ribonuclease-3